MWLCSLSKFIPVFLFKPARIRHTACHQCLSLLGKNGKDADSEADSTISTSTYCIIIRYLEVPLLDSPLSAFDYMANC